MKPLGIKQILVTLVFALIGWALCGSIMGIGMAVTTMQLTLIVHAIGAPIIFGLLSWLYYTRFNYTNALQTAIIFTLFVMGMDFFVVALLIEKSFEMFSSALGTWLPFTLIYLSTYMVGIAIEQSDKKNRPT